MAGHAEHSHDDVVDLSGPLPSFCLFDPIGARRPFGPDDSGCCEGQMIGQMYIDDTGTHSEDGEFIWAGFFADYSTWAVLSRAWVEVLRKSPEIGHWHTVTAHNGRYGDALPRPDRESKERALAEVIAEQRKYMVGVVVSLSRVEHRKIVQNGFELSRLSPVAVMHLQPRLSPAYMAMRRVLTVGLVKLMATEKEHGEKGGDGSLHCIFEDRAEDWQDDICLALRAFRRSSAQDIRRKLSGVSFVPGAHRESCPPLQAADLFAWHVNRTRTKPDEKDENRDLIAQVPTDAYRVTAEEMHALVEETRGDLERI